MILGHFKLEEFIDPDIFSQYGDQSVQFLDDRLIHLANAIREYYGVAVTINNWHLHGQFSQRGLRRFDTTTGAKMSQHKFGRAIDINIAGKTPQEIYADILENEKMFMEFGLTTIENIHATPTWNHLDVRYTGLDHLLIVNP